MVTYEILTVAELNIFGKSNQVLFLITQPTWGESVLIMEKSGKAFCRIYWYSDDSVNCYLDFLNVEENSRHAGLGTKLQMLREEIGRLCGSINSRLWVISESWMHEWYKRRGYSDLEICEHEKNCIWMNKSISN